MSKRLIKINVIEHNPHLHFKAILFPSLRGISIKEPTWKASHKSKETFRVLYPHPIYRPAYKPDATRAVTPFLISRYNSFIAVDVYNVREKSGDISNKDRIEMFGVQRVYVYHLIINIKSKLIKNAGTMHSLRRVKYDDKRWHHHTTFAPATKS